MEAHKSNIITFIFSKNINTTKAESSSCVCVLLLLLPQVFCVVCVSKENAFTYIIFLVIGDLRVCRTEVYLFFFLLIYMFIIIFTSSSSQPTNNVGWGKNLLTFFITAMCVYLYTEAKCYE
jgi:hypothetical protein